MNEGLRLEYENYLAEYYLKPRKLDSLAVREAETRKNVRRMYEEARSRDDPFAEVFLMLYEQNRERDNTDTRFPATRLIEETAAQVEENIRTLPTFAGKFHDNVFVGEFPTGSINCATVKVPGGFLILVHSGMMTMLQQVVNFLLLADRHAPDSAQGLRCADGIAEVLAVYVENGDPFFGPKPLAGGMSAITASQMTAGARKFVIAHEYGHVLAGHLTEADHEQVPLETEVGTIAALRKDYAQELEADDIGYSLTLGVTSSKDFDFSAIEAAKSGDWLAIFEAVTQECLVAAPFIPLMIDAILEIYSQTKNPSTGRSATDDTHPSALERLKRLLERVPGHESQHLRVLGVPSKLTAWADRIVETMLQRVGSEPAQAGDDIDDEAHDQDGESWLDAIMLCVDALRAGDIATAALALTDAFQRDRTILGPESEVVQRELVRAALGRPTDVTFTLVKRQKARRRAEEVLGSASRDPYSPLAVVSPSKPFSLASAADLMLDHDPKGLSLVKTILDEEASRREHPRAEFYLVDAIISAWRGEREKALSSFENALAYGVPDPGNRLAHFIALDKRALRLSVPLDTEEMIIAAKAKVDAHDAKGARELAGLIADYTDYLGVPVGPLVQSTIEARIQGHARLDRSRDR